MPGIADFFGQLFGNVAGGQDGAHIRIWNELKPWAGKLVPAASRKWIPRAHGGEACEVPIVRGGRRVGDCDHLGLAECVCCGKPVCLQHAHINEDAVAICYVCVADAMNVVPPLQRERARQPGPGRRQQRQEAPPPAPKPGPSPEQILAALRVLGLKPGAKLPEIKAAWKALSAKHHPDRQQGARSKAAAEAKFKEVQAAYELLKRVTTEAA